MLIKQSLIVTSAFVLSVGLALGGADSWTQEAAGGQGARHPETTRADGTMPRNAMDSAAAPPENLPEQFETEESMEPCNDDDRRVECQGASTRNIWNDPLDPPPFIPFKLESDLFPTRCLRPSSSRVGSNVILSSCANYSSRYWTPIWPDGSTQCLKNNWSKLCLKFDPNNPSRLTMGSCGSSRCPSNAQVRFAYPTRLVSGRRELVVNQGNIVSVRFSCLSTREPNSVFRSDSGCRDAFPYQLWYRRPL